MKTTKLTKKEITEELYLYVDTKEILSGTFASVANKILALEERLKKENQTIVRNPDLFIRYEISLQERYNESAEIVIYGIKMETDEAFDKRVSASERAKVAQKASAKKQREARAKKELQTYLALQKKFGNNINVTKK